MATYVVMEPPGGSEAVPTDRAVLVRDGFHLLAFIVPVFWLLWHRLWIEAALVFAVTAALAGLSELAGAPAIGALLSALVSIWAGLEAPALKVAAMRRRGWIEAAAIEAQTVEEAETRYLFDSGDMDGDAAFIPAEPAFSRTAAPIRHEPGLALGLMAYPDRR